MRSFILDLAIEFFNKTAAKKPIKFEKFRDGIVINGDSSDPEVFEFVKKYLKGKQFAAIVTDPPYLIGVKGRVQDGKNTGKAEEWDQIKDTQQEAADWMFSWTKLWWPLLIDNGAFYCWGATGTYKMHPFFLYLTQAEHREDMKMFLADVITWKKRRAFGSPRKLLYVREECAYFLKSDENTPRIFNIPYLDQLRGYDGFGKYKAKSPYLRRGNVWTDITEMFSGKLHSSQKPVKLMEIQIETSTNEKEIVLDMFGGSGTTAVAARNLGRKFVIIEQDLHNYKTIINRLKNT